MIEPSAVSDYQELVLGKLKEFTQFLFNTFDIQTFAYRRFLSDGRSFGISTNHEWNKWHNTYLFLQKNIPAYEKEVLQTLISENNQHLWFRTGEPDKNDELYLNLYDFDIWNTLCIYKNNTDHVEGFYFATNKENTNFTNFFLNHIDIFKYYIFYFKNNFLAEIDSQTIDKFSLPTISKESFIQSLNKSKETQTSSFFESIKSNKFVFPNGNKQISLSKRELDCLQLLSAGKSSKEIARILDVSPRTIEEYLNRIKTKSNIHYKSGLINFFNDVKQEIGFTNLI